MQENSVLRCPVHQCLCYLCACSNEAAEASFFQIVDSNANGGAVFEEKQLISYSPGSPHNP